MNEAKTRTNKRGSSKSKNSWKNRGKSNHKEFDKDQRSDKNEVANDPSWYTQVGQLTSDVASLSFNNPVGLPIHLNTGDSVGINNVATHGIPGILRINTTPATGVAGSTSGAARAINIAAQNLYTFVRHENSGHANYDRADLMIYLLALDSIYSFWAWMTRVYGIARVFSQPNRYIGDALLNACGADPVSIRANLADFRAYLNEYALKASTFAAPRTMSLFQRHVWMYSTVYKDEDVLKAQLYLYNPAYLWQFKLDSNQAGMLEAAGAFKTMGTPHVDVVRDFNSIRALGDLLLDAIYTDEDSGIISGDILKAYGKENLWQLTEIAPDYAVYPIFSEEVLTQIHNTRFCGLKILNEDNTEGMASLNLTQNPNINGGNLIFAPKFGNNVGNGYDAIIDTWKDEVKPEDVIVATRNMPSAKVVSVGGTTIVYITSCGSDLCLSADLFYYNMNGVLSSLPCYSFDSWWYADATAHAMLTKFNEYPHFMNFDNAGNYVDYVGELSNYTIVSAHTLEKMNDSAILSMLAVPYIGTVTR